MAQKKSKNARTASGRQTLVCKCGGEIKGFTVMKEGRIQNYAECLSCHQRARKPKMLM